VKVGAAPRLFYGWIVVAAAFVVMLVGFGSAYTFAAFFPSLQEAFGASRGDVSLVFSLAGFLYFALGPLAGALADRHGPRLPIGLGVALLAAGLAAAGGAGSLLQVYLAYGVGVGVGVGLSYVPAVGAVQPWFARRRAQASGYAVAGIGVGTLLMPPLAVELIAAFGWRGAYLALGALALALGGAAAWLIERSPAARGLHPDGAATPPPAAGALRGLDVREAMRSRTFWALYAACLAVGFGVFSPFVHLAPYSLDLGHPERAGVLLLSLMGAGSLAGRFFLGGLADRFGRRRSLLLMFAGIFLAQLIWLASSSLPALACYALLHGCFYGGFVALIPAVTMDYFGLRSVNGVIGLLYTSVAFGTLIGPTFAGLAFDLSGSYLLPIAVSAGLAATGGVIAATMRKPPA
jgi:MFS family permease